MKKVYVTQIPHRFDRDTRKFTPSVNISSAEEHGEVVVMLEPTASFHATEDITRQLRDKLKDYDYEAGDSIVFLGDPAIIALACAILSHKFGRFTLLKWDRSLMRYLAARIIV